MSALNAARALVVYPLCLDHVGHGNIQRILRLASYLAADGFELDLVYQGNPRIAPVPALYSAFRRVHRVQAGFRSSADPAWSLKLHTFYGAHEMPGLHLRPSGALAALVRALLEAEPYRAVIATYAWTAPVFADLSRPVLKVLDVQDILHEHASACRQATGGSTTFSLPEATEEFLWRQWDVLLAITPEDEARIQRALLPYQRTLTVRHAVDCAGAAEPGSGDVALYAGSDNQPNIQAVQWLLERVWPRIVEIRPRAELRIAGLICRALPDAARSQPNVRVLGFLPDLDEEVGQAGVILAPYLYGSGLKIKVVEAAAAGKAIVTTRAGIAGSGLDEGRAVEVQDDPDAFAAAVATLLAGRERREALATAALERARRLYSPHACYGPVSRTIRLLAPPAEPSTNTVHPDVIDRLRIVFDDVEPSRVVIWGNGAHTRALLAALAECRIAAHLIVDKQAASNGVSAEGLDVVPAARFQPRPDDLIVLSSETFEAEMWSDLAAHRAAGAHVLGLYQSSRISASLAGALSMRARVGMGAPAPRSTRTDSTRLVLWDSNASHERWWRLAWLDDIARSAARRGWTPEVVVTRWAGPAGPGRAAASDAAGLPILESDPAEWQRRSGQQGPEALAGLVAAAAPAFCRTARALSLAEGDTLCLISPCLTECFGVARGLASMPPESRPLVVLHDVGPAGGEGDALGLDAIELRTLYRLALSELAAATGNRLVLTAADDESAARIEDSSGRAVVRIGRPVRPESVHPHPESAAPRIVAFGHVGDPHVRPLLNAISQARAAWTPVHVSWRSAGGEPRMSNSWARELAIHLELDLLDDEPAAMVQAQITRANVAVVLQERPDSEWVLPLLASAAAAGVPVVVPSGGPAAAWVLRHGVRHAYFAPGDPPTLVHALQQIPFDEGPRHVKRGIPEGEAWTTPDRVLDRLARAVAEHADGPGTYQEQETLDGIRS